MSGPWEDFAAPAATGAPWEDFAASAPAEKGVPNLAAASARAAAYKPPTLGEKIRGAVEAGINTVQEVLASVPSMAGGAAGFLGALARDFNVKTTPGAPASLMVDPAQGFEQGASMAHAAARGQLPGQQPPGEQPPPMSDTGQDYSQKVADVAGPVGATLAGHFPTGEIPFASDIAADAGTGVAAAAQRGRANLGAAANTVRAVAGKGAEAAAGAAGDATAAAVRGIMPQADPQLAAVAQLADQFPHPMTIRPDQIVQPGVRRGLAQTVSQGAGSGSHAIETANREAFTRNLIDQIEPGSTDTRLTAKTYDEAMDRVGAQIGGFVHQAGPLPGTDVREAMLDTVKAATSHGAGDAPRVIQNRAEELLSKIGPEGSISPQAVREWDSDVGRQIRSTTDPELAGHLSDLQDAVRDVVNGQLGPEDAQALNQVRRQYAYGMMLAPDVAKAGTEGSMVGLDGLVQPGKLINAITRTRVSRNFVARDDAGPIGDLARVGQLIDSSMKDTTSHGPAQAHTITEKAVSAGGGFLLGKPYNSVAGRVTRDMLPPKAEAPAAEPPPAAPPALLGYEPHPPLPVTGEGQAVLPEQAQAREDFGVSQRNAGGTGRPALATTFADHDLGVAPRAAVPEAAATPPGFEGFGHEVPGAPPSELAALEQRDFPQRGEVPHRLALGEPPKRELDILEALQQEGEDRSLGDLTPDWSTSPGAGGTANRGPEPGLFEPAPRAPRGTPPSRAGQQIPAVPGRPDLPDVIVSGPRSEHALDEATGREMQSDNAALARRQQGLSGPPPAAPAPPEPAVKFNPDEQAKADEIQAAMASTQSDIVRATLAKELERVTRAAQHRITVEKAKAAADELRTAATGMADPVTKQALLKQADKLDPPEKIPAGEVKEGQPPIEDSTPPKSIPAGKTAEGQPPVATVQTPKEIPAGKVTYVDDPNWRRTFGLDDANAARAMRVREAFDLDPQAVESAASAHDLNPTAFDAEIDRIFGRNGVTPGESYANASNQPAGGGQGAEAGEPEILPGFRRFYRAPGGEGGAGGQGGGQAGRQGAGGAAAGQAGAGQPAAGQHGQAGTAGQGAGQRGQSEDAVTQAAQARFEIAHPRGSDGQFVEKPGPDHEPSK